MVTLIAGLVILTGLALWMVAALVTMAAPDPNKKRVRETIVYLVILGLLFILVGMTSITL
jgi:uncharacterized iron-regulated membrane protein